MGMRQAVIDEVKQAADSPRWRKIPLTWKPVSPPVQHDRDLSVEYRAGTPHPDEPKGTMKIAVCVDGIDRTIKVSVDCSFSPDRRHIPKPDLKSVSIKDQKSYPTSDVSESPVRQWVRDKLADFIEQCARQYEQDR
jgi:hypothetical protein